ncbi:MAG: dihydropteroate synthase [Cellulomonadaceae bacterium]|jgi:dihydropteroate synthase|nr:dihydropteroate synthase [Cellulomonadaceae bacterium]
MTAAANRLYCKQSPPCAETQTLIMGIVNVTADSFSDGGRYLDPEAAIAHGLLLASEGGDIIDVGGESTRPGAERVTEQAELERVIPVVRGLAAAGVTVSADTMRAEVASQAIAAGATIINDVSSGLADARMAGVIAAAPQVKYVAGHWRGMPAEMDKLAVYHSVVGEVAGELAERQAALFAAGVAPEQLILDPNLGFAKLGHQNWQVLAGLAAIQRLGQPVLIGASRKRFLRQTLTDSVGSGVGASADLTESAEADLDLATAAVTALVAAAGAWAVRVHNVKASRIAADVAFRFCQGSEAQSSWAALPSRAGGANLEGE